MHRAEIKRFRDILATSPLISSPCHTYHSLTYQPTNQPSASQNALRQNPLALPKRLRPGHSSSSCRTRRAHPCGKSRSADDPSWYCQWKRRVVFDAYTLEGRNWGSAGDESLLRKQIGIHGGWVTNWRYENNGDGVFRARVNFLMIFSFLLPCSCSIPLRSFF
jgi:hypothetical protein